MVGARPSGPAGASRAPTPRGRSESAEGEGVGGPPGGLLACLSGVFHFRFCTSCVRSPSLAVQLIHGKCGWMVSRMFRSGQPSALDGSGASSAPLKETPSPVAMAPHPHPHPAMPQAQAATDLSSICLDLPVPDALQRIGRRAVCCDGIVGSHDVLQSFYRQRVIKEMLRCLSRPASTLWGGWSPLRGPSRPWMRIRAGSAFQLLQGMPLGP